MSFFLSTISNWHKLPQPLVDVDIFKTTLVEMGQQGIGNLLVVFPVIQIYPI